MIRRFLSGDKGEFLEVHGVVALAGHFRKGLRERAVGARGKPKLIGIHMHKPVSVKRVGEPLFAFQNRPPTIHPRAWNGLDADQTTTHIAACNSDRLVRRAIVDKIDIDALLEKVLQATGDESFLVVSGQQSDHARNYPSHAAQILPNLTGQCSERP